MRLTVLSLAYALAPVTPETAGGAEQILLALDQALTASGDRSIVVACEGSRVQGQHISFALPGGTLGEDARERVAVAVERAIERALDTVPVDLIHLHGLDFHRYKLPPGRPAVATLHMPLGWYPEEIWTALPSDMQLVCVSAMQRASAPSALLARDPAPVVIENGVALEEVMPGRAAEPYAPSEPYALVLGRICPEKNVHAALDAGSAAGLPVWIGGQVFPYPEHEAYFAGEIVPRLGGLAGHRFLGPLGPARKRELLAGARCLLVPSLAPETSSLVAMEALAAGTPVIAYGSGALPAIVDDGVTGFLVDSVRAMAAAIGRVNSIDRSACRAVAERRFGQPQMVAEYRSLYSRMLDAG